MPFSLPCSSQCWPHALKIIGFYTILFSSVTPTSLAQPPVLTTQSVDLTPEIISGELSTNSPILETDGSFYEQYTFEGVTGEVISIELTSNNFDTYLILKDPTGELIAQNDDRDGGAGTNTNSEIRLALPSNGIYTVIVNSYGPREIGTYNLRWRSVTEEELKAEQLEEQADQIFQGYFENPSGVLEEGIAIMKEALALKRSALGNFDQEIAESLFVLTQLLLAAERYSEAEAAIQETLEIQEIILGNGHPEILYSLQVLAVTNIGLRRYAEAEELAQRVLSGFESLYSSEHSAVIGAREILGAIHRYQEINDLYQFKGISPTINSQNLYFMKKGLKDHNSLLYREKNEEVSNFELMNLYFSNEHLLKEESQNAFCLERMSGPYKMPEQCEDFAETFYLNSIEYLTNTNYPSLFYSQLELALLYVSQGRYPEAENWLNQAFRTGVILFGDGNYHSVIILQELGELYIKNEQYSEAKQVLFARANMLENLFESTHPELISSNFQLAVLNWIEGDLDSAALFLEQGLSGEEKFLVRNLVSGGESNKREMIFSLSNSLNSAISFHLNDAHSNEKSAEIAFSTILQRKGRVLDLFTNIRTQLSDDSDAILLLDELENAINQLSLLTYANPMISNTDEYIISINTLQERISFIEEQLFEKPEFAVLATSPALEDIKLALPEDSVLIEFVRYRPVNPLGYLKLATSFDDLLENEELFQKTLGEIFDEPRYAAYVLHKNGSIYAVELGMAGEIDEAVKKISISLASPDTPDF